MKKKTFVTVIILMLILIMSACQNQPEQFPTEPTPTPTITLVEVTPSPDETITIHTPTPTVEVEPTPTDLPIVNITLTPAPVITEAPSITLEPTITEVPVTVTPTETINPTTTPTATPELSPIPTITEVPVLEPTKVPEVTEVPNEVKGAEVILEVQMGDNVWYRYYDNKVLVVSGTGSTYEFAKLKERNAIYNESNPNWYDVYESVEIIIIEEGITRLGKYSLHGLHNITSVTVPSTLTELGYMAFAYVGSEVDNTDWIGLDMNKITAEETSFSEANVKNIKEETKDYYLNLDPTPTPTPTPDPNNPKLIRSAQMGDNVTFEFYDTGYLYVKGSGATYDMRDSFRWNRGSIHDANKSNVLTDEQAKSIHHLVVEEGITYLGEEVLDGLDWLWTADFPKSLGTNISYTGGGFDCLPEEGGYYHGYVDGKEVIVTFKGIFHEYKGSYYMINPRGTFDHLEDAEWLEKYQMTVTWVSDSE